MEKDLLLKLVNQGLSTYQIASKINKSQSTTRYWLDKYSLKTNKAKNFNKLEWAKERERKNRKLAERYKMMKGCSECGYKDHVAALEFDHLPQYGKREKTVGSIYFESRDQLKREIRKCDVVCANCHRIRTYNRKHGEVLLVV